MNLSFAKDSKTFSKAVEALRAAAKPLTEENIRKEYVKQGGKIAKSGKAGAPATPPADDGDSYDEMSGPELKKELKKRKLPVSGKVDVLRGRLRDDDAVGDPA